jgi:hypothetical protein
MNPSQIAYFNTTTTQIFLTLVQEEEENKSGLLELQFVLI